MLGSTKPDLPQTCPRPPTPRLSLPTYSLSLSSSLLNPYPSRSLSPLSPSPRSPFSLLWLSSLSFSMSRVLSPALSPSLRLSIDKIYCWLGFQICWRDLHFSDETFSLIFEIVGGRWKVKNQLILVDSGPARGLFWLLVYIGLNSNAVCKSCRYC